jgi:RNA ligase
MYTPNFEELDKLVASGHLRKVISPCKKFKLYNYTDKTTYDRLWNEHTSNSRGTIYCNETGEVLCRAFPKFHNYSEFNPEKQKYVNACAEDGIEVYEKIDGSLGILGFYGGKWRVSTRGSFTSDQANYANEKLLPKYDMSKQDKDSSYMIEIIYPMNRIIVDYGKKEELVLLTALSLETGGTPMWKYNERVAEETGMGLCKKYDITTIEQLLYLQKNMDHTEEGFVVRFPGKNIERVKFKSLEYLNVARLTNYMTPLSFWKALKNGKVEVDFLEHLPEEFRKEAEDLKAEVERSYENCRAEILLDFAGVITTLDVPLDSYLNGDTRKALGLFLKENKVRHSGAMFQMLLGNDLEPYILKTIRPTNNKILDK